MYWEHWEHWDVLGCTGMYWDVSLGALGALGRTGMYWDVLGALGCTGRGTGMYWEALGALGCTGRGTGMYWDVLGRTGMYWEHWEVTPGDRRCPHSFIEDNEVGTIDPTALRGLRGLLYL